MKTKIFCHGILKNKEDKILFLKRNKNKLYGELWDLPGGKLEENEDYQKCVIREFKEETNINVKVDKFIDVKAQIYNNNIIIVLIFLVTPLNPYNILLNDEHIDYIFEKAIDLNECIWYLKKLM